jgi:hypothetical protein
MSVTHVGALRTDLANLVVGNSTTWSSGSAQKLKIYAGTPPANAAASLSGNTLLSTITGMSWGAAVSGVATLSASTSDPSIANTGTATFFRLYQTAGADPANVILQGTVGTSGADLIVNSTSFTASGTFALVNASCTYQAPV